MKMKKFSADDVYSLTTKSQSQEFARHLVRYRLSGTEWTTLAELATRYLSQFPVLPGACVIMSAGFSALVSRQTKVPAVVAAGGLAVGGKTYYRPRQSCLSEIFDQSRLDWNGHAWVIAGDHIMDLSIFRTAYSGLGPKGLQEDLTTRFGSGSGVFISKPETMRDEGMHYKPLYVLTREQEAAFAVGANAMVDRFGSRLPMTL
jgi:hypothetical protein